MLWRDLLLGGALLFGVAACTWQGIKPDGSGPRRLYISGSAPHVSDRRIAEIAAPYLKASFFDVDLEQLQAKLAGQPWLTGIAVSRHWPDGVIVHVAEHKAVALWGPKAVLAADGAVFTPSAKTRPSGLIHLHGPDNSGLKVYQEYQDLSAILAGHGVRLSALDLDARGSWTATLADGLQLRLGRRDLDQRMHRFVDFALSRPKARKALATAGYVDLRYSDGFAVGGSRSANPSDTDQEKVDEQAA